MAEITVPVAGSPVPQAPAAPRGSRVPQVVSALVLIFITVAYIMALAPTACFWDAGEFVACSWTLGIPHPPGAPLFNLMGRLLMMPFQEKAYGCNLLTALFGALTFFFLHLTVAKIVMRWRQPDEDPLTRIWIAQLSGAAAALFAAFDFTNWGNCNGTEVYSPAFMFITLSMWLLLRWEETLTRPVNRIPLLAVIYFLALGTGFHREAYMGGPSLLLFVVFLAPEVFRDRKFWMWGCLLTLLGLTIHFYTPIRSALNPNINENAPHTWNNFWYYVSRRQYRPPSFLDRQAPFNYQLDMFWRYFNWQFPVSLAILGIPGMLAHMRRGGRTFIMVGSLFVATTLGMLIYMNFSTTEVRDRDYFYSIGFATYAIWIGMGLGMGLEELARLLAGKGAVLRRGGMALATGGMLALAMVPLGTNWHDHDVHNDWNPDAYGYNMLVGLDQDAIIFTNGDNDTFPLWFEQEVKQFRRDVRIVNLSLLNTDWYIWQLKHYAPTIPMSIPDNQLPDLRPMKVGDKIMYVRDIAMQDIINTVNFSRPIYMAVTVPGLEEMGLADNLVLEGMAFKLVKKKTQDIDLERCRENMWDKFHYRGLLTPDGKLDDAVYRDDNTKALVTNYSAAYIRMAMEYERQGKLPEAIKNCERSGVISPDYVPYRKLMGPLYAQAGDYLKAEEFLKKEMLANPSDSETYLSLGYVYEQEGRTEDALANYRRAMELDPNSAEAYRRMAAELLRLNRPEEAAALLEKWLGLHPEDGQTQRALQQLRESMARAPSAAPSPAPDKGKTPH